MGFTLIVARCKSAVRLLVLLSGLALFGGTAQAQLPSEPNLAVSLSVASLNPAPGSDVAVVIDVAPGPGWHIYWQNPGESGYPPRFTWQLPTGVTMGEVRHPAPSRLELGGIAMNVHAGRTLLLTSLHVPANARSGQPVALRGSGDFLVCSDSNCQPVISKLALDLTVGDGRPDAAGTAIVEQARQAQPLAVSGIASFFSGKDGLHFALPLEWPQGATQVQLFSASDNASVIPLPQQVTHSGHSTDILLPASAWHPKGPLDLVVHFMTGSVSAGTIALHAQPGAASGAGIPIGFLTAFFGAILGGLLLNLMPCVFPILSLKALSLARAGGDPVEAKAEGVGYLIGACGVMLALGALVLSLRAAGSAVGWAFQLQSPIVVAVLLLLMVGIAVNLAGLFELPTPSLGGRSRGGLFGGIGTGALAAFVATPCTGPFMAGALGAALVLPVPAALAVFAGLGFGLALPFVAIALFDPVRRWLPRPGQWMVTMRHLLAIPMFATALGLVWLLGRLSGVTGMTLGLACAILLALALWWWGLRQRSGKSFVPALAPAALAFLLPAMVGFPPASAAHAQGARLLGAIPFDAAKLADLRAKHRPVFLFATADWCLTCKVNEQGTLASSTVAQAFHKGQVTVMEADWTHNDPAVTQLLTGSGRAGVPLYVWYASSGAPQLLPQILTPGMLANLTS
jgi:thiol:disulfide interchange protein/DsbC/DsbD-like thiol-disulfide interchange protein